MQSFTVYKKDESECSSFRCAYGWGRIVKLNIIEIFLEVEISDQEFYEAIYDFISSYNIRYGEYEGNEFIIKKIDRENFLIFNEYVVEGRRNTSNYTYMNQIDLLDDVSHYANKQGYKLKHSY